MHIKFVVDTRDPETGEWSDSGEAFDTQSQAEQYILSLGPNGVGTRAPATAAAVGEDTRTRIRRSGAFGEEQSSIDSSRAK